MSRQRGRLSLFGCTLLVATRDPLDSSNFVVRCLVYGPYSTCRNVDVRCGAAPDTMKPSVVQAGAHKKDQASHGNLVLSLVR